MGSILPMGADLRGLLFAGGQLILRRFEKDDPLPYLRPQTAERPHVLWGPNPGPRHDWAHWIADTGLVVYRCDELPPENTMKYQFCPRLLTVPPFHSYFSPPEVATWPASPGGKPLDYRVVDFIHVPKQDYFDVIPHFDNWFGFRWLDENRKHTGPVIGLWSEKPMAPGPLAEVPWDEDEPTKAPTTEPDEL